jgi:putative ABC transport system permease protein
VRLLARATLGHLARHPAQLLLALGGLTLGVATIVAVDVAVASADRAFVMSLDAVEGRATHYVAGGPTGLDESLYVRLRAGRPGVALAPVVEGYVSIERRTFQLIGLDPFADPGFRGRASAQAGSVDDLARWFEPPGSVSLSSVALRDLRLAQGDAVEIRVAGRRHAARVGTPLAGEQAGADALLLADIALAQEWLGLVGRLSRIALQVPEGEAGDAALEALAAQLPPGLSVVPTARRGAQSEDLSRAFTTNLEAMSLLGLLVALFLIYSAVSFAVLQRRRALGVLRALGATRRELLLRLLGEAALLGIAGTAIGLAVGYAIGRELVTLVSRTINDLYFVVAVREVVVPATTFLKAVAAGVGVALIAAAVPAIEAAYSPPQLALRRSSLEGRAARVARMLVPASLMLAALAFALTRVSGRSLTTGFVALLLLLLAVAALAPATLRGLARVGARVTSARSPVASLAIAEVGGSLSRTGVAVAALGLALAATIGVSIMVGSFRESLRDWLAGTLSADLYVSVPGPGFARPERRLEPAVVDAVLALPGIARHGAARRVEVRSDRGAMSLDAIEFRPGSEAGTQLAEGDPAVAWPALRNGALLVSQPLAWRLDLGVGDTLALDTAQGRRPFAIAGIYREYGSDRGSALLDRTVYQRLWQDDAITSLALELDPSADAASVAAAVRAAGASQSVLVVSNRDIRELSLRVFERTFTITRVLQWITAGVAAIGLLAALLAWELERGRELAIVRTLGLTPRGAAALVTAQSACLGAAAWLAAVPAGLLAAVMLIDVINRRAFGWEIDLHVTAQPFVAALGLALAASLLAALWPAWRAGGIALAREVREE